MKISHTYFPNGHRINWWHKVPFETQFSKDKYGNIFFNWFRDFKKKLKN